MAKEVFNYKNLEERRTKPGLKKRNKGFYTVVFYLLKAGKKVTVNSISEVEALVRNAGGKFPGIMGTRKELARTDNKLYFYKKTANWSSAKEIGYLKCNDFDKLLGLVYGGYGGKAHD